MIVEKWTPGQPYIGKGAPWVIRGCLRCGRAIRRHRTSNDWHCTDQCRKWEKLERDRERRAANALAFDERVRQMAIVPLHVLYPGMMAVAAWAQERRPSYETWRTG